MLIPNQNLKQSRYRIIRPLVQHGTYEAFDNVLKSTVLLKEFSVESTQSSIDEKVRLLFQLRHESLLRIFDHFAEFDRHFLAIEKSGESDLGQIVEKSKKPFSISEIISWAKDLFDALNYLHTQNPPIFHGNIRPQNLRLTPEGKIKLATHRLDGNESKPRTSAQSQSFDAATLAFTPLEQIWESLDLASQKVILNSFDEESQKILEQPPDARSDLYALGATLYYLATARLPSDALTRSIEILEGNPDPLVPPQKINPEVPREISDILMKALEIKREHRFSSAVKMYQSWQDAETQIKAREEREASGLEEENVLEIPIFEPPAQPERPAPKQIEAEQLRQLEIIKQQLREAEEKRLEAERRAAEAEKRLLEKESQKTFLSDSTSNVSVPNSVKTDTAIDSSAEIFDSLTAQTEKSGNSFLKVAVGIVILVVVGGSAWGVLTLTKSPSNQVVQPEMLTSEMPSGSTLNSANTTNSDSGIPTSEKKDEVENRPDNDSSSPSANPKIAVSAPATKNKAETQATSPQQAKKQPSPTPKDPEPKKKSLTLDDLLKDN